MYRPGIGDNKISAKRAPFADIYFITTDFKLVLLVY